MFRGQGWFGLWCMLAAGCTSLMKYLEKRMAMSVRHALYQRLLANYLDKNLHFYRLPMDDASSRLTSDLAEFSNELTHTVSGRFPPHSGSRTEPITVSNTVLTPSLCSSGRCGRSSVS
jgi:ABC-type uncharacterized transport system fused permease/ATPase subunit